MRKNEKICENLVLILWLKNGTRGDRRGAIGKE